MDYIVNFTPGIALAGGLLIGLAAVLFMATLGRIAGISGIFHSLFTNAQGRSWRLAFLIGLIAGAGLYVLLRPGDLPVREGFPALGLIIAGLLVGIGTRLGSGCTSGHGVCGLARRSERSLTATLVFMALGFATAIITRHVLGLGT